MPTHLRIPQDLADYPADRLRETLITAVELEEEFGMPLATLAEELALCREAVRHAQRLARVRFTPDEQAALVTALNGTIIDRTLLGYVMQPDGSAATALSAQVDDVFRLVPEMMEGLDVQPGAFHAKLATLDPAGVLAILLAARRYWERVGAGEELDPRRLLEG